MHIYKIIALCIAVALASVALLLYARPPMSSTPANKENKEVKRNVPQFPETTLNLSPDSLTLSGSGSATIDVMINTGQNQISGAQLEIRYDPTKITITDMVPGDFFPNVTPLLNTHDRGRGRIDYVLAFTEEAQFKTGTGNVVTMNIMRNPNATSAATTQIDFLPKTSVRNRDQQTSLLKNSGSTTIILEAIGPEVAPF